MVFGKNRMFHRFYAVVLCVFKAKKRQKETKTNEKNKKHFCWEAKHGAYQR
jgi:hypothetical protein